MGGWAETTLNVLKELCWQCRLVEWFGSLEQDAAVSLVVGVLNAGAIVAVGIIGADSFHKWRERKLTEIRLERAAAIYGALQEAEWALKRIRKPMIAAAERDEAESVLPPNAPRHLLRARVVYNRLCEENKLFVELRKQLFLSKLYFEKTYEAIELIIETEHGINRACRMLSSPEARWIDGNGEFETDKEMIKYLESKITSAENDTTQELLGRKVATAFSEMKHLTKPFSVMARRDAAQ